MYENKTVEPVESVLRRGMREKNGGVNLIKIYRKSCVNVTMCIPLYNYYMLIKIKEKAWIKFKHSNIYIFTYWPYWGLNSGLCRPSVTRAMYQLSTDILYWDHHRHCGDSNE
jgi:hypothetical protein